jgi:hypothetical protein
MFQHPVHRPGRSSECRFACDSHGEVTVIYGTNKEPRSPRTRGGEWLGAIVRFLFWSGARVIAIALIMVFAR